MNGKKVDLSSTSIKSENDSLRHSLHQVQQSLSLTENPASVRSIDEPSKSYSKRRVRRRASAPIKVPSPQRSPYTISTSSEEGFLYKREVQAWDDSMATASHRSSKRSDSFSLEMQHSYYSSLRSTLPALVMSPQEGHLPKPELMKKGPLMSREQLFAEEDSTEQMYIEKDKLKYEERTRLASEKKDSVGKRPDTPMTTLLMKITEL